MILTLFNFDHEAGLYFFYKVLIKVHNLCLLYSCSQASFLLDFLMSFFVFISLFKSHNISIVCRLVYKLIIRNSRRAIWQVCFYVCILIDYIVASMICWGILYENNICITYFTHEFKSKALQKSNHVITAGRSFAFIPSVSLRSVKAVVDLFPKTIF